MKRISIDDYIKMPIQDLDRMMANESHLNEENHTDEISNIDIDMNGLFISDIAEQYHLITIDEVKENIKSKLNH